MMKMPTNRSDSCELQPSWVTPEVTVCTSSAPSSVPSTDPRPPMIDVPPITTAAITASSLPVPTDWSSVEVPWAMTKQDAEPDQQPGDQVGQQHPALHPDAGQPGGVRVAADGVEVPAARGVPQVPPGDRRRSRR